MSRASTIVQEIKQVLQPVAPNQVYRYLKPLDQINDFPTICLYISKDDRPIRETLDYKGEIDLRIRGYVYGGEDSQALSDQLSLDIEDAIMSAEFSADNVQITEVSTDEGLLEPMGIVEMRVFIRY